MLDSFHRPFAAAIARISGRAATALTVALAMYGAGLALPLALHCGAWWTVVSTLLGTATAAVSGLALYRAQMQSGHRRHLVKEASELRTHNPPSDELDWLVGEVFQPEGWAAREAWRPQGPTGVDLDLTRDGQRIIAQCKRRNARFVGVREIREFACALIREGLAGEAGIFVTLSEFTSQARSEAGQMGIHLIDNRELCSRVG